MDLLVLFLTVPLVTAFVGWITNWAAVKLIFWPREFIGIGPIGWQGVLPRMSGKFAAQVARTLTGHVLGPQELVDQLEPDDLDKLLAQVLDRQAPDMTREVVEALVPGMWDDMAPPAREAMVTMVSDQALAAGHDAYDHFRERAQDLIDIDALVVELLTGENTDRLIRLTQEIGRNELRFIVWYGGVFGFLIGLVQAAVFQWLDQWWLMPIIGVVVGLVTNWLAIQMIFRPHEETTYLGVFRYQGMFAKRQDQIAADYGRITAAEILTPENLFVHLTQGEAGERISAEVLDFVARGLDESLPLVEPLLPSGITDETRTRVREVVSTSLLTRLPEIRPDVEGFLGEHLDVETVVRDRLASLSKPEFERILRGIFEEDEVILIVIGGVLGGLVGLLQGAIVLTAGL